MKFSDDYLAGLFDGEGCIFIQKHKYPSYGYPSYMLYARINMCHQPMIALLAEDLEASIITHRKSLKNPNHRDAYEISLHGVKAADFLYRIYSKLVVKQEEARLAIEFQKNMTYFRNQIQHMTVAEAQRLINWREAVRLQVKALKKVTFIGVSDWNAGELGEPPMPGLFTDADGQPRTKQELTTPGVRNEQVPASKEKICSELGRNVESAAEMTAPDKLRLVR